MRKILTCLLLFSGLVHAYGQKILTVDFDQIKQRTSDEASPYYYPKLIARFVKGDTLTGDELRCVYYGTVFQENNNAGDAMDPAAKFEKYYRKEQFRDAVPLGLEMLQQNPVNIRMSFRMMVCYHYLDMKDSARLYARRYYGLINAIMSSGDGISASTAMVVTQVPDEYDILNEAKFKSVGQTLLEAKTGRTDKLTLDTDAQQQSPKVPALYFNVEMSFILMEKLFGGAITLPDPPKTKK